MMIKFNLFAQVFLLLGSAINALLFYFFEGDENLSLTLYVLMFFAQVFIIISCIMDVVLDKSVNKFMVFGVGVIYVATVLFFGRRLRPRCSLSYPAWELSREPTSGSSPARRCASRHAEIVKDIRDFLPDVRDGLTRQERTVHWVLHKTQKERRGRNVPTAMLWGRVCEHFYISPEELSAMLARLGARASP